MPTESTKYSRTRCSLCVCLWLVLGITTHDALTSYASANDTSAELAIGGLVFGKNDNVEMLSEDLYISTNKIDVHYRFFNKSSGDLDVLVAFPLPDLKMDPDDDVTVIPSDDPVNFVDFETTVNGQPVHTNVEQKNLRKWRRCI